MNFFPLIFEGFYVSLVVCVYWYVFLAIMVKPFTIWHSNFGESFLSWISNKCNYFFFENMYISRNITFSVLLLTCVKARRRRYLEKYTFFFKKLKMLDIHKRKLSPKFECHIVNGLTIVTENMEVCLCVLTITVTPLNLQLWHNIPYVNI